jgi:hypothetical protein
VRYLGRTDIGPIADGVYNVAVSGKYVSFGVQACGTKTVEDCRRSYVRVLDVLSGKTWRTPGVGVRGVTAVDLVVRRNGTVAYLALFQAASGGPTYVLRRFDRTNVTDIDSGPDLVRGSLALAGATLYWTKGGQPHSAQL